MTDTISAREQRAIEHLTHCLTEQFNIPQSDIQASMVRSVSGMEGGQEVKRDHIQLTVANPVVSEKGEALSSLPVQHKLADELARVWGSIGSRPLVTIDIPYPERPAEPGDEGEQEPPQELGMA